MKVPVTINNIRAARRKPGLGGNFRFDIGTAGSTTLVLQTVLPALLTASRPSSLELLGGTHNPWAPPFDGFFPMIVVRRPQALLDFHEPHHLF